MRNVTEHRSLPTALQALSTGATAVGTQLPGVGFFISLAPPLFPASVLLLGSGGLAIFVTVFVKRRSAPRNAKPLKYIALALIAAAIYGILFQFVTVPAPAETRLNGRYQVGFGVLDSGLTPDGREMKRHLDRKTAEELMLALGGYEPGAVYTIWAPWAVVTAGSTLIILFGACYLLWAYGLALVALQLMSVDREVQKSRSG